MPPLLFTSGGEIISPPFVFWRKTGHNSVMEKNTFELIYDVVKRIPKGCVATYGQVAMLAGNRHWSQVVGYALHVNPDPKNIPCHRVVNRFGGLSEAFAFGGKNRQAELLSQEGVESADGTVDLDKYLWRV